MRLLNTKKNCSINGSINVTFILQSPVSVLIKQLIAVPSYSNFFYFKVHKEDYDILKLDGLELARSNLA